MDRASKVKEQLTARQESIKTLRSSLKTYANEIKNMEDEVRAITKKRDKVRLSSLDPPARREIDRVKGRRT